MEASTYTMKENRTKNDIRDEWINKLTAEQYNCLLTTLEEIGRDKKITYNTSNFPINFIKTFDEAFIRKDWLTNLSENQVTFVKINLKREKYLCPTLNCCECCQTCKGDGKITYQLHNFPFEWIEKYNEIFETENIN